jgi:hypothetical protein
VPTGTFEYRSDAERLAIEAAIAFVTELHQLALTAPPGHVLDQCEAQALDAGRTLLRDTVAGAVQTRITVAEKKGAPRALARAPDRSASNGGVTAKC